MLNHIHSQQFSLAAHAVSLGILRPASAKYTLYSCPKCVRSLDSSTSGKQAERTVVQASNSSTLNSSDSEIRRNRTPLMIGLWPCLFGPRSVNFRAESNYAAVLSLNHIESGPVMTSRSDGAEKCRIAAGTATSTMSGSLEPA